MEIPKNKCDQKEQTWQTEARRIKGVMTVGKWDTRADAGKGVERCMRPRGGVEWTWTRKRGKVQTNSTHTRTPKQMHLILF